MKHKLNKAKRKLNKVLYKDAQILLSVLTLIILVSLIISLSTENSKEISQNTAKYELTETDIFSLEDFNANDVSVMGIKVGDRTKNVLEVLGTPDKEINVGRGISTFEYSKGIELEETGLILSLNNGILESITIREPFNKYLTENTKIEFTKDEVYNMFGIPDETIFMPMQENSAFVIRVMRYETIGLDFIIRGDNVLGFSFRLNDGTKTHETHTVITIPSAPKIIT